MKPLREVSLDFARVQLFENNLVRLEMKEGRVIGFEQAREMTEEIGVLNGGRKALVLMVADEFAQFDSGAREYSASSAGTKYTIADAMVVKNVAQRLLANMYLKFNKPGIPSRVFNSEKEAMEWLFSLNN